MKNTRVILRDQQQQILTKIVHEEERKIDGTRPKTNENTKIESHFLLHDNNTMPYSSWFLKNESLVQLDGKKRRMFDSIYHL